MDTRSEAVLLLSTLLRNSSWGRYNSRLIAPTTQGALETGYHFVDMVLSLGDAALMRCHLKHKFSESSGFFEVLSYIGSCLDLNQQLLILEDIGAGTVRRIVKSSYDEFDCPVDMKAAVDMLDAEGTAFVVFDTKVLHATHLYHIGEDVIPQLQLHADVRDKLIYRMLTKYPANKHATQVDRATRDCIEILAVAAVDRAMELAEKRKRVRTPEEEEVEALLASTKRRLAVNE